MKIQHMIPTEKAKRTYRYAAVTVCMLLMCALFCAALYGYSCMIQKITQSQASSILRETSVSNARMLEYEINNKMMLFQRIADQYHGGESHQEREELIEKLEPILALYDFKDVGVAAPDGEASSVRNGDMNIADAEFFQNAMKGAVEITKTENDKSDGKRINIYSAPISSGGTVRGVFYAVYDTEKFTDLFFSPFEGKGYSYVVDASGDVMISENGWYGNIPDLILDNGHGNRNSAVKVARDLKQGRSAGVTYEAKGMKYAYYSPLGINDWSVVTIVPASAVMEQYQPIVVNTRYFCIFMGCFCVAAAGFFLYQQRKQNRRLQHYAYVDPLTGGRNNTRFMLDAVDVLRTRKGRKTAILAVDINRFKMINQMLGIDAGNRVIYAMEQTLLDSLRNNSELTGHRVADRFVVLWMYQDKEELIRRLEQLCQEMERLSQTMENICFHASIGVYEVPETEKTRIDENYVEQLCGNALMAGQTLKGGHTTAYRFWDDEMKNRQIQNKIFEDEMYPALERNEFVPWFQPKVDLQTGKLCGAEALVRWQKEDGTLIPPVRFIPFFETNGFIEKVDRAVMEAVCRWQASWKKKGLRILPVSVNLSKKYLCTETFAREWRLYLETNGLDVEDIRFEVTETVAAKDKELMKKIIDGLHAEGFKVLLDDFGTGYSSLLALQDLDFDILKLDCKFAWGIGHQRTEKILQHVIAMAKSLNMETIAEGVETEEQYRYLKELGVDSIQGFYFYRPMPAEEYEQLLGRNFLC